MRRVGMMLLAGAVLSPHPAMAADSLKFGPPPAWVHVQPIPPAKPSEAPFKILLNDQQVSLSAGKITTYGEAAFKIQNSQGLDAGNLSIVWQPATDTVTVNKLQIRRGDKVIDVLANGQTFTVLRRETDLEAATLDGTLTGNIQPEGLEVGDIVDFATTVEHSDPVLKDHVESTFGAWNGSPIEAAHVRLSWPSNLHLNLHQTRDLPAAQKLSVNGMNVLDFSVRDVQPLVPPRGAPLRFTVGRFGEATDFASWSDLANLFIPLFRDASVIPASGPLHDEVEKIRASTSDPKRRSEQALALVQDRVRYVALEMGQGGYVPAAAETTWSRRFGDCKGKTALLLGILHSLGIEAEPVLAQPELGDMIADRLPMVSLFDHVLVRAHIGGKDYWLDGTRTGDVDLDSIEVPDFGWGLPLVQHAQLVHIQPPPLNSPETEIVLQVDASGGVYAPAPATADQTLRDDVAVAYQSRLSALTEPQQQEFFQKYWGVLFDFVTFKSGAYTFDKSKRELHLTMMGDAKLDWSGGYFHVPQSSVGFHPDFDRPEGPQQDAPFAVDYPSWNKTVVRLRFPPSFVDGRQPGSANVHETLAGIEYDRSATINGTTLTVETDARSVVPEISYKDAKAAEQRLIALNDQDVSLPLPGSYRMTDADFDALHKLQPATAAELVTRGNTYLNYKRYDDAIADFSEALKLEPSNKPALADRGLTYVWKHDYQRADEDLKAVEAKDPNEPVMLRARGLEAEFKGDFAKGVDFYSRSLAEEPGNGFALGHRANCEAALSSFDEALADSAQALKLDPAWLNLRLTRANIFVRQNNRVAAAHEAELAQSEDPHSQSALVTAGRLYGRLGMNKEAMAAFDRALAIKPSAYVYLSRAQSRPTSDKAGRIVDTDEALKLEPDNSDALLDMGFYLADAGRYADALSYYDRAMKNDHSVEVGANRAVALYKLGKTAEAEKTFAALRTQAKTADELNNLCWIKATAGILLDSALEECRGALKMKPGTGPFLDSLAMVLLKLGKTDEALDAYNQAIAKNVGADSLMGRAFVYLHKGERGSAEADAAAARKQSPNIDDIFAEYGLRWDDAGAAQKKANTTASK